MNCGEAREVLYAFLDSELESALSIEVQRHLESCAQCGREAETEREIRKRLAGALERVQPGSTVVEDDLRDVLVRAEQLIRRPHRRWRPGVAAAAAFLLLAVSILSQFPRTAPAPDGQHLVETVVADFEHFLEAGRPIQIASADRNEVSRWLREQTGVAVSLPVASGEHCRLIGARKCKLNGRPAAFALYEMNATPACLVAMADASERLDPMRPLARVGRVFWIDRCKEHTVVAYRSGSLLYAAVSRADADELIHLMSHLE
ncbi:MAG: zf-HC2 domain-containing protein [Phycisphaerae bacterium]|nr:zf-HC2 domain-containing protein [Phycisphaerae bacterium]NUQ45999.1 zf-HC2 domain-containing protein [Phycisphaerae bacterium]